VGFKAVSVIYVPPPWQATKQSTGDVDVIFKAESLIVDYRRRPLQPPVEAAPHTRHLHRISTALVRPLYIGPRTPSTTDLLTTVTVTTTTIISIIVTTTRPALCHRPTILLPR
jgi:hypothetical protein